jgi:hypothetical protein
MIKLFLTDTEADVVLASLYSKLEKAEVLWGEDYDELSITYHQVNGEIRRQRKVDA